jgi:GT2 family glycosyltransferase
MFGKELYNALTSEGGFFDEKIFMYYEDADLALRARKIGARFFIANDITLTHLGGGSAQSNTSRALQHDRAQQYVFKKHFGLHGLLLSKGFRILRSSIRIASAIPHIGSSEKRKYLVHHLALLKAALW